MTGIPNKNSAAFFDAQKNNNANSFAYDLQEEKKRIALGIEELKKEISEEWKKKYANAEIFPPKVAAMHPEVVDFLLGFNSVFVYDDIAKQAGLDAKGRNELPHIVWEIAETKNWENLEQILKSKIPLAQPVQTKVSQLLEQNILSKIRELSGKPFVKKEAPKNEPKKEILQISLAEAMQQYPKIGEQAISINLLKLRYFPSPVRPSIKNWITDFHENMGAGKHSSLDRANYIFHSDNGKKLTPVERQKLSLILKSLEEKMPLSIDPEKQAVVFEKLSFGNKQPAIASRQTAVETRKPEIERKKAPNEEKDIFQRFNSAAGRKQTPSNFFPNFTKEKGIQEKPKTVENLNNKDYFRNIEKKSDVGSENYFSNFSSTDFKKEFPNQEPTPKSNPIRFSSAQKFPAEQNNELIKEEKQVFSEEKNSPKPIDTKQPRQKFQWQLKPTSYRKKSGKYDISDDESNYSGNVVNLKS